MSELKIGDRVQIRRADDLFFGHLGYITDHSEDVFNRFAVRISPVHSGWYAPEDLANVTPAAQPPTVRTIRADEWATVADDVAAGRVAVTWGGKPVDNITLDTHDGRYTMWYGSSNCAVWDGDRFTVTPVTPLPSAAGDEGEDESVTWAAEIEKYAGKDPKTVVLDQMTKGYADAMEQVATLQAENAQLRAEVEAAGKREAGLAERNRHLEVVYQMAVSMDAQTDMLESLFGENVEAWAELSVALDELRATQALANAGTGEV